MFNYCITSSTKLKCTARYMHILINTKWTIACQAPVYGIIQAGVLVAIPFSMGSSRPRE